MLDGRATFLKKKEKELALARQRPYLVRWVREFLRFAWGHAGYTFAQTLDLFLAEMAGAAVATLRSLPPCAGAAVIATAGAARCGVRRASPLSYRH